MDFLDPNVIRNVEKILKQPAGQSIETRERSNKLKIPFTKSKAARVGLAGLIAGGAMTLGAAEARSFGVSAGDIAAVASQSPSIAKAILSPTQTETHHANLLRVDLTSPSPSAIALTPPSAEPHPEALNNPEKNLFKDVLGQALLKQAGRIRQQRDQDPAQAGWRNEINPQIMNSGVGILFSVKGSEFTFYGEDDRDSIISMVYYPSLNKVDTVSLNRDISDPITTQAAILHGENVTQPQELMKAGRYGVLREASEAQTGIPGDIQITLTREAVMKIVDNVFGEIQIDVPEEIPTDEYGNSFKKGPQMMSGEKLAVYLMTRTSTSVEARMGRQNNIIPILIDETVKRLHENGKDLSGLNKDRQMLTTLKTTLDQLQSDGSLETNLDYHELILAVENNLGSIIEGFKGGSDYLQQPTLSGMVVDANKDAIKDPVDNDPRQALHAFIDPETGQIIRFDPNDPNTFGPYYAPIRQKTGEFTKRP